MAGGTCYARSRGSAKRSSTSVRVALRSWVSSELISSVLKIVLSEWLGYHVELTVPTVSSTQVAPSALAASEFDCDLEVWLDRVPAERRAEVFNLGPVGYPGRAGFFVNEGLLGAAPLADYYSFWRRPERFQAANVSMFGELDLKEWLGEEFPFCKQDWCSTGQFEGYWVPPRCRAEPEKCALVPHPTPVYDLGYFEQLVSNHNLSVIIAYTGFDNAKLVERRVRRGRNHMFYWWEPDPLIAVVRGQRISFPDWEEGCQRGNTKTPYGSVECDIAGILPRKMVRQDLRTRAPEAWYAISKMEVFRDDMLEMIKSTAQGGGSLTTFEAACAFVKSREARLLAKMAPSCIRSPPASALPGELIFDPELMACKEVPAAPTRERCLPEIAGTVDRHEVWIKVARHDWLSHNLASSVLEILLREYMGYTVQQAHVSDASAGDWGPDMEASAYDVDVENRFAPESAAAFGSYVRQKAVVLAPGAVGYGARSSLFVLPHTAGKDAFLAFWRSYRPGQGGGSTAFYTLADVDLRGVLGSDFPVCREAWCAEGAYVPPLCESNPQTCVVAFSSAPDTGYYEQLTKNLGLTLVHAYMGSRLKDFVLSAHRNASKDLLFEWVEPDPLVVELGATRVSFPDHTLGCDSGDTRDPRTGTVACDFPPQQLQKLLRAGLAEKAPEVLHLLELFKVTAADLRSMLRSHTEAGGALGTEDAACEWVKANFARLRAEVVPDCIARPKRKEDVRVGDVIFRAAARRCEEVRCLAGEALVASGSSVICRPCGAGQLPSEDQTHCVRCWPGSSTVEVDGQTRCACNPGYRQVDDSGVVQCELCPVGTHSSASGMTACSSCPAGRYASRRGSTTCLPCEAGSATELVGSEACELCAQGSFQSEVGATSCSTCGEKFTTQVLGAEAVEQCICDAGFFRESPSSPCQACPKGMVCPLGSDSSLFSAWHAAGRRASKVPVFPNTLEGHMSLASAPLFVYACSDTDRCPGGPPGGCGGETRPDVISCSRCLPRHYWHSGRCVKCSGLESSRAWFPLLPGLLGPVVVALLYRVSRDDTEKWGRWPNCMAAIGLLLVNHLQITSVVAQADFVYSDILASALSVSLVSEDPLSMFRPQCAGIVSFRDTIVMRALAPLTLLLVVLVSYMGSMAFTTFKCAANPNGKATLMADRSVHCFEGEWNEMVAIAVGAILYILSFGALFCWAAYTAPWRFRDVGFRRRWKFLFIKFRPDVWWWSLLFCVRGVLTNVGFIFMQSGFLQVYWVMAMVMAYSYMLVMFSPWRHIMSNTMDVCSCFSMIALISLLTFHVVHVTHDTAADLQSKVDVVAIALIVLPPIAGAGLLTVAIKGQVGSTSKASQEHELRCLIKSLHSVAHLSEDQIVQMVGMLDEWGRWHIMSALQLAGAEAVGLERQVMWRLVDGTVKSASALRAPAEKAMDDVGSHGTAISARLVV